MNNKLYTARELSEILKVSPKTIYKAAERGEIESYRVGKSVRFTMPQSERTKQNDETAGENTELHD